MRTRLLGMLGVGLLLTCHTAAEMLTNAWDNASSYGDKWLGNGGFGFDEWVFRLDDTNYCGSYVADANSVSLNYISSQPDAKAWGTWANTNAWAGEGTPSPKMAAFRGFGWDGHWWRNGLREKKDTFRISMENGYVRPPEGEQPAGAVGFVLRHGNFDGGSGDFNNGTRFEFACFGGTTNYILYDARGLVDTGVSNRSTGLHLELMLLDDAAAGTYSLKIFDAADASLLANLVGTLAGDGSVDSVALYNRDSNAPYGDDTFFNNMAILKQERLGGAALMVR